MPLGSVAKVANSSAAGSIEAIYERYIAAWAACDVDAIMAQHSDDSTFWMHNGEPQVSGREAVRARFAETFKRYPKYAFEVYRVLFGDRHWVLDWVLTTEFPGRDGKPVPIRIDMVDIIDVNDKGQVIRKDTFMDGAQAKAQFAKLAA